MDIKRKYHISFVAFYFGTIISKYTRAGVFNPLVEPNCVKIPLLFNIYGQPELNNIKMKKK